MCPIPSSLIGVRAGVGGEGGGRMVVTGNDRWGEVICYQYGAAADDAGVLHWVAVCCSVLQCVVVRCSVL